MRRSLALLAAVALAGCGGSESRAERVADCLNEQGWLVSAEGERVLGTTDGGVGFVVELAGGRVAIDDSGNPPATEGAEPATLSSAERAAIEECAA